MNKNISKIKDGILIGVGILFVVGVANAWTGLQAESGDTLTYTKWNELIDKVDGIFTDSNGKVGIGTETPTRDLSISSTAPGIYLTDEDDNSDNQIASYQGGQLRFDSDINNEVSGGGFYFRNNGNGTDVYINDNGNVGIGTINPQSKLQIGTYRNSVNEYLQIDFETFSTPPSFDCDSSTEEGRMIFAGGSKKLYICDGDNGWKFVTFGS